MTIDTAGVVVLIRIEKHRWKEFRESVDRRDEAETEILSRSLETLATVKRAIEWFGRVEERRHRRFRALVFANARSVDVEGRSASDKDEYQNPLVGLIPD